MGHHEAIEMIARKMTSFLNTSNDSLIGKPVDQDILSLLPSWRFDAMSVTQTLPGFLKNAATVISFEDEILIGDVREKMGLLLVFQGSVTPSKSAFDRFPSISRLCSFDESKIKTV